MVLEPTRRKEKKQQKKEEEDYRCKTRHICPVMKKTL